MIVFRNINLIKAFVMINQRKMNLIEIYGSTYFSSNIFLIPHMIRKYLVNLRKNTTGVCVSGHILIGNIFAG